MRQLSQFAAVLVVLVAASGTQASEGQRANEKAAKKACATGDYRKGVEILAQLYVDTDKPILIFNQGRCYEQNHQWVSAIDRFREYMRKMPPGSDLGFVEKHIADCERFREQDEPKPALAPAATQPPPVESPPVVPAMAPPPPPVADDTERPAPASPSQESHTSPLRVTGIVLGSVGIATAALGLVLNLKANSLADEYGKTHDPATNSSHSSYKTGSMICYGAGAAMLAAGVALYIVGRPTPKQGGSTLSLLPAWSPGEYSLGLRRTF